MIEQVIVNLAVNARDAMPKGGKLIIDTANILVDEEVAKRRLNTVAGEPYVRLRVSDTGLGIAPGVMDRLYEAFYTTKSDGMGMGLSLCRSIIESHRGRIQAENIYNGSAVLGCRFAFWIPLDMTLPGVERVRSTV
jgi:signal transduction histidine kinase